MKQKLSGGRKQIYRENNTVLRPANEWTPQIHLFLHYLQQQNFTAVPRPISLTASKERVSFLKGDVLQPFSSEKFYQPKLLISVARLLRDYHLAGRGFLERLTGNET